MTGPSSTPNFVGRDDELAIFERAVAEARQGAPAVLLVGGEAGIGKSTLVTEGARRAAADLIVGRCLPMGGELIPLAPLAELLRNVRRTHPAALSEPALAPLRDWIGRGPAAQRPAAGALFAPLLELVADLGADGAVVVGFEDLHWADPLTWDLFDFSPAISWTNTSWWLAPTAPTRSEPTHNNVAASARSHACPRRTACSSEDSAAMSSPRRSRP